MKHLKQNGFSTVEGLLLLIVILLIGFTGWFVLHSKQNANTSFEQAASTSTPKILKKYTDTANLFTLSYPENWKFNFSQGGGEGAPPDWTKESRPFSLIPANAPKDSDGVTVDLLNSVMVSQTLAANVSDKNHTLQHLTVNGKHATLDKLVYVGPSAAEKYTDDTYYIFDGSNNALRLTFRQNYYHNYPKENWNDSKDLEGFTRIVKSVKFKQ